MSCLHQLNQPAKLENCLKMLQAGDSLLLIEAAISLAFQTEFYAQLPEGVHLLLLADDLLALGASLPPSFQGQLLSDTQWVEASLAASQVCSW